MKQDLETKPVLKALTKAHRAIAELKGAANSIPNQGILIDTLSMQEAKASSEIENIVTTQDELFQVDLLDAVSSPAAKEVALYRDALKLGFQSMRDSEGGSHNRNLIEMFRLLKGRNDGFRQLPGTELRNDQTGETVYVPPQGRDEIENYMAELEKYINNDELSDVDPLIKMAVIHHQFESIHPFPDGNGRIGRILNVLYLTRVELLDIPILYLSRQITETKDEYYRLLQKVRDEGSWEEWILYILEAARITSELTLKIIHGLKVLMAKFKFKMRDELPKIYSQDLLNNLFRHPYTRIEYVMRDLGVARQTASRYLKQLTKADFVVEHQVGNSKYYINAALIELIIGIDE